MISLCCPTRGRPASMKRFAASAFLSASNPDAVEVLFYVDDDDELSITMAQTLRKDRPVSLVTGPRIVLSECWNRCADAALGQIFAHMGDDIVIHTPGWDRMIEEAFAEVPDRILLAYGRDGIHDERLSTHGFVHRRWVEIVGYLCPPLFSSDWNDQWLYDVAGLIDRRRYLPDLYTEHLHFVAGKAELDETHRERMARGERDGVNALYQDTVAQRHRDADKLRAAMNRST